MNVGQYLQRIDVDRIEDPSYSFLAKLQWRHLVAVPFENLDILTATHIRANDIMLDTALEGMTIPLHPGAQRYYREMGIIE